MNRFKFYLETRLDAAVRVAICVFRFAMIAAADGFRIVELTFTPDFLATLVATLLRGRSFWALRVLTPSKIFDVATDDLPFEFDVATFRIEFVATDRAKRCSTYFFFKA